MTNAFDRTKLAALLKQEEELFHNNHAKSHALYQRARKSLYGGVPMLWMIRWAGSFPVFVKEARGARFTDVDGHSYIDFCLGDTGAMTGHSPVATVKAVQEQIQNGVTLMLPYEDVIWVGEELQRRFGLPYWQFALTATDANRFALRMARLITGRSGKSHGDHTATCGRTTGHTCGNAGEQDAVTASRTTPDLPRHLTFFAEVAELADAPA